MNCTGSGPPPCPTYVWLLKSAAETQIQSGRLRNLFCRFLAHLFDTVNMCLKDHLLWCRALLLRHRNEIWLQKKCLIVAENCLTCDLHQNSLKCTYFFSAVISRSSLLLLSCSSSSIRKQRRSTGSPSACYRPAWQQSGRTSSQVWPPLAADGQDEA